MPWVKIPPEHHPLFRAALPSDPRIETVNLFGGIAAKLNGHIFAGLFGRSTMVHLAEPERTQALALEGAEPFDPMGDGRRHSNKVMLPESVMDDPAELRQWLLRALEAASALPKKAPKKKAAPKETATPGKKAAPAKKAAPKENAAPKKRAPTAAASPKRGAKTATKRASKR